MRITFRNALCAVTAAAASVAWWGPALAQGTPTPWVSPDEAFRNGSQLLADLNGLKCYDRDKAAAEASWQVSVRGFLAGSPSLVQMSEALKKAHLRTTELPHCKKTGQISIRSARRAPPAQQPATAQTPRTPGELLQDTWSIANRATGEFTGMYFGGRVGGQRADSDWTTRTIISIDIVDPLDPNAVFANPAGSAVTGGAFVGYNFALPGNFIAGVEVGLDIGGDKSTINGIPGIGAFFPGAVGVGDTLVVENKWGASIVGQLGAVIVPHVHAYGLFGYAWQRTDVSFSCDETVGFCSAAPAAASFVDTQKLNFSGPVAGAGVEFALGGGWIGRLEYRRAWLNDKSVDLGAAATRFVGGTLDQSREDVTFGLRFPFGASPPPPPPP